MKVLLANPPARIPLDDGTERYFVRAGSRWPFSFTKKREDELGYAPFPFYMAYTAAVLHDRSHQVNVIDSVPLNQTEDDFLCEVLKIRPKVVLIESTTPTFDLDAQLVKRLRAELGDVVICMSGPHVTTFPKETLEKADVDYVFRQEYEIAFSDFVDVLARSGRSDSRALKAIAGIAFLEDGTRAYHTTPPRLIMDLDALPFPKRDIFPSNDRPSMVPYWNRTSPKPVIQMHASRGCPFRCDFCLWNQVMYDEGKYRCFSPRRIVDEMESLQKEYGIKEVYFDDDTFTGNRKHVLDFCAELSRRKLGIKWMAMGDMIITNEEMLRAMANTGCTLFKFGVETADPGVLRTLGKPVQPDRVKEMVRLCARLGIQTHATFTFGLEGDSRESILRTYRFAKELDVDSVQFSINTPFPGTRFYDSAKVGNLLESEEWSRFDGGQCTVVKQPGIEHAWLEDLLRRSLPGWLFAKLCRPSWVLRQIRYVRRTERLYGTRILMRRVVVAFRILGLARG